MIILISFYSKNIAQEIFYIDFLEIIVKYGFYIKSFPLISAENALNPHLKFPLNSMFSTSTEKTLND